jgi:hypothetical protein
MRIVRGEPAMAYTPPSRGPGAGPYDLPFIFSAGKGAASIVPTLLFDIKQSDDKQLHTAKKEAT